MVPQRFQGLCWQTIVQPSGPVRDSSKERRAAYGSQQIVEAPPAAGGGTGPLIVLRLGNQASPYRIQFDVTNGVQEVVGIERRGEVAALPKVAATARHAVDALCVLAVNRAQGTMHGQRIVRYDDQMNVIRH